MTSPNQKPFMLTQSTFLASQSFVLPQIPVEIIIQLHKSPEKTDNKCYASLNHFIKTPLQKHPAPLVNQLNQTLVFCNSDNDTAFQTIRESFFAEYEETKKIGLMPSNSWLIPNSQFVKFNDATVK
ncbi:MAG: hypothetical protein HKK67_02065 [Chlorobiaceae bacterium]|nr:hypothetical protein [Chlorobiaceae bacterium]